jgi:hypothetical protein
MVPVYFLLQVPFPTRFTGGVELEKGEVRIDGNEVPLGVRAVAPVIVRSAGRRRATNVGRRPSGVRDDEGLSLIEVIVALGVLLIAFVAVALLLQTNFELLGSTNDRQVAGSVAAGNINQQRQNAANQNAAGYFTGVTTNISATTAATWCNGTCNPITQTVQNVTYYVYVAGGWCFENSSGTWGNDASSQTYGSNGTSPYPAYPAYFVAVKVAWGGGAKQTTSSGVASISSLHQVVLQSIVTPNGGYGTYSPTTGPISSCPTGVLQ